jgi:hypothetical protein
VRRRSASRSSPTTTSCASPSATATRGCRALARSTTTRRAGAGCARRPARRRARRAPAAARQDRLGVGAAARGRASLGWRHAVDRASSCRAVLERRPLDLDALRAEVGRSRLLPVGGARRGRGPPRSPRLPSSTAPTSSSSRSTRSAAPTSTRPSTSRGTAAGYRVSYAIADVGAFVVPGGALDAEVEQRGVTLYAPDRRVPLHPPVLGEQAASLLPDGPRPALLWQLDLDADGGLTATDVRRALVRSRAQLDYEGVQARARRRHRGRAAAAAARGRGCCAGARAGAGCGRPCRRRSRRWSSTATATRASSCGPRCRSRAGTPRSACSPAPPPRS